MRQSKLDGFGQWQVARATQIERHNSKIKKPGHLPLWRYAPDLLHPTTSRFRSVHARRPHIILATVGVECDCVNAQSCPACTFGSKGSCAERGIAVDPAGLLSLYEKSGVRWQKEMAWIFEHNDMEVSDEFADALLGRVDY